MGGGGDRKEEGKGGENKDAEESDGGDRRLAEGANTRRKTGAAEGAEPRAPSSRTRPFRRAFLRRLRSPRPPWSRPRDVKGQRSAGEPTWLSGTCCPREEGERQSRQTDTRGRTVWGSAVRGTEKPALTERAGGRQGASRGPDRGLARRPVSAAQSGPDSGVCLEVGVMATR